MTAQHTPGPWAVGPAFDNDGEPEIIIEHHTPAGNLVVAVALAGLRGQEANARLIAAAPDLLAVVIHARNVLPNEHWADDTRRMLDAAIARATHKEGA